MAVPRDNDTAKGAAPLHDLDARGVHRPPPPSVRADRILRIQGYVDSSRVRPAIRDAAERCARRAAALADPVFYYRRVAVTAVEADRLVLETGTAFSCAAFAKILGGCGEVVVFVMTLGPDFDSAVADMAKDSNLLDAVLLDTAGWLCVEAATKRFADELRAWARPRGVAVSPRMGPGYGYRLDGRDVAWRLEDQAPLFALFADVPPPVQLLDSCAMLPKMSRSGLFGLRPRLDSRDGAGP